MILIRAAMCTVFFPVLTWLARAGYEPTKKDAAVMTWGGLRGAVGLALAMSVRNQVTERDPGGIQGIRVLFHVGGLAGLTLLINGTTSAALLRWLGMTKTPKRRKVLLDDMRMTAENDASRRRR